MDKSVVVAGEMGWEEVEEGIGSEMGMGGGLTWVANTQGEVLWN